MDLIALLSENTFYEVAAILVLAAMIGAVGLMLRQPLVVMFIALGILVGPSVLNLAQSTDNIHLLAEIGIAILLFIVGLKLDLRIIKSVGRIALLTGMGQVIFTSLVGFFIGLALGFSTLHSFYIAVALTFSSTIIIVKLLSDKKEIDSLHGQIAIGFLIVQDIVVILVMIVLSAIRSGEGAPVFPEVVRTIGAALLMLVVTIAGMRWVIPHLSFFLAKSQELLSLFAVALAVGLATVGEMIGFSGEVGAFLAGVSLASSEFKDVISSRLVSLRDFLLLFFFVNLGATLDMGVIQSQIPAALIFSAFVLIGNPIIVLIIMGLMGYRKRTSFLAGLTVAQISEFSLIFAGLGFAVGHITEETVGLITLVGLVTIGLSTYLILYSHQIYDAISPVLSIFERKIPFSEQDELTDEAQDYDVVLIGLGRFGTRLSEMLDDHPELTYLGIDFDPEIVRAWQKKGKNIVYGDMEDPDLIERLPLTRSKVIVSTVSDYQHSKHLMKILKEVNYPGKVFLTSVHEKDYELLLTCDPEQVLRPQQMAAINFYNYYLKDVLNEEHATGE